MDDSTRALLDKIAEDAAEKTARRVLLSLGLDCDKPVEVQRDLAALRELRTIAQDPEYQADLIHLRRWRKTMENVQSRSVVVGVSVVVAAVLALLWAGFRQKLGV